MICQGFQVQESREPFSEIISGYLRRSFNLFLHWGTDNDCQVIKSGKQKAGQSDSELDEQITDSDVLSLEAVQLESLSITWVSRGSHFLGLEGIWSQGINSVLLPLAFTLFKDVGQKDHGFYEKTRQRCSRLGSTECWGLRRAGSGLCHCCRWLLEESGKHKAPSRIRVIHLGSQTRAAPASWNAFLLCLPLPNSVSGKSGYRCSFLCEGYPDGLPFDSTLLVSSSLWAHETMSLLLSLLAPGTVWVFCHLASTVPCGK